jgi:nucleolar protein 14
LRGFVNIYHDIISFPEVFASFVPLLHEIVKENKIPESLQLKMTSIASLIKGKIDEHEKLQQPLRMRMKKSVPIKQFNPRFEEKYSTILLALFSFHEECACVLI